VDVTQGQVLRRFEPPLDEQVWPIISPDGWSILCDCNDKKIHRWDIHTGHLAGVYAYEGITGGISFNDFTMDERRVYATVIAPGAEKVWSWDLRTGRPGPSWAMPGECGAAPLFAMPGSNRLAVCNDNAFMLDLSTGTQRPIGDLDLNSPVAWVGADGPFVCSRGGNGERCVVQVYNGKLQSAARLDLPFNDRRVFVFSRDRRLCVAAKWISGGDHARFVGAAAYDLRTQRHLFDRDATGWDRGWPCFTADSRYIVVQTGWNGKSDTLEVFDVPQTGAGSAP
jgi:hypothetical protein